MTIKVIRIPTEIRNSTQSPRAFQYDSKNNDHNSLIAGTLYLSPPPRSSRPDRENNPEIVLITNSGQALAGLDNYLKACQNIDKSEVLADKVNEIVDQRNERNGKPPTERVSATTIMMTIFAFIAIAFSLMFSSFLNSIFSGKGNAGFVIFLFILCMTFFYYLLHIRHKAVSDYETDNQNSFWLLEGWGADDSFNNNQDHINPELLAMIHESLNHTTPLPLTDREKAVEIARIAHMYPEKFSQGSAGYLVAQQESEGFDAAYRMSHWKDKLKEIKGN